MGFIGRSETCHRCGGEFEDDNRFFLSRMVLYLPIHGIYNDWLMKFGRSIQRDILLCPRCAAEIAIYADTPPNCDTGDTMEER